MKPIYGSPPPPLRLLLHIDFSLAAYETVLYKRMAMVEIWEELMWRWVGK